MSGWITEQGAIDTAISLLSFTMDDKREGKTKVPHLMDKKNAKPDELLLSMRYQQDAYGNQTIDLNSKSFFLCLCPEFLGSLTAFFVVSKSEEEHQLEEAALTVKAPKLGVGPGKQNTQAAKSGKP